MLSALSLSKNLYVLAVPDGYTRSPWLRPSGTVVSNRCPNLSDSLSTHSQAHPTTLYICGPSLSSLPSKPTGQPSMLPGSRKCPTSFNRCFSSLSLPLVPVLISAFNGNHHGLLNSTEESKPFPLVPSSSSSSFSLLVSLNFSFFFSLSLVQVIVSRRESPGVFSSKH